MSPSVLLAIDPGPSQSAFVAFDPADGSIGGHGIVSNEEMLAGLRNGAWVFATGRVVIEKVESFGMAVGAEVFATVLWAGRFMEAVQPVPVTLIGRKAVKIALCGSMRAKDANIRAALIDRYGPGKDVAVGTKAKPGPLYGISKDVWSALAVAVTYADGASS